MTRLERAENSTRQTGEFAATQQNVYGAIMDAPQSSAQKFGGFWSVLKVDTVAGYLDAFCSALKNKNFNLVYIDAFAGSGAFSFAKAAAPLFDENIVAEEHAGSAARALAIKPGFDELYFIERSRKNLKALNALIASDSDYAARAEVLDGDANKRVRELCKRIPWHSKSPPTRGVIFLDPFGTQLEWPTLEAIAQTKALDVWYLFPLMGVVRNSPLAVHELSQSHRTAVTRALGTEHWMDHFYKDEEGTGDLFLESIPKPKKRSLNPRGIEAFVRQRLQTVFPLVLPPRTILGNGNTPLFSLFFAMSNDSPKAQALAIPIAESLLKPKPPGTRPRSARKAVAP